MQYNRLSGLNSLIGLNSLRRDLKMILKKYFHAVLILLALTTFSITGVFAEEAASAPAAPSWDAKFAADTVWVLVTAFLVFFMNLGFGMLETGLCR